jgi:hypothetical protein
MKDLLNCLFTSFHILAHGYLLVVYVWPLCEDSLLFASLGIMVEYSYLNIYLYTLRSTPILISCFSRVVFDEFIVKRGENVHKVG